MQIVNVGKNHKHNNIIYTYINLVGMYTDTCFALLENWNLTCIPIHI